MNEQLKDEYVQEGHRLRTKCLRRLVTRVCLMALLLLALGCFIEPRRAMGQAETKYSIRVTSQTPDLAVTLEKFNEQNRPVVKVEFINTDQQKRKVMFSGALSAVEIWHREKEIDELYSGPDKIFTFTNNLPLEITILHPDKNEIRIGYKIDPPAANGKTDGALTFKFAPNVEAEVKKKVDKFIEENTAELKADREQASSMVRWTIIVFIVSSLLWLGIIGSTARHFYKESHQDRKNQPSSEDEKNKLLANYISTALGEKLSNPPEPFVGMIGKLIQDKTIANLKAELKKPPDEFVKVIGDTIALKLMDYELSLIKPKDKPGAGTTPQGAQPKHASDQPKDEKDESKAEIYDVEIIDTEEEFRQLVERMLAAANKIEAYQAGRDGVIKNFEATVTTLSQLNETKQQLDEQVQSLHSDLKQEIGVHLDEIKKGFFERIEEWFKERVAKKPDDNKTEAIAHDPDNNDASVPLIVERVPAQGIEAMPLGDEPPESEADLSPLVAEEIDKLKNRRAAADAFIEALKKARSKNADKCEAGLKLEESARAGFELGLERNANEETQLRNVSEQALTWFRDNVILPFVETTGEELQEKRGTELEKSFKTLLDSVGLKHQWPENDDTFSLTKHEGAGKAADTTGHKNIEDTWIIGQVLSPCIYLAEDENSVFIKAKVRFK